MAMIPEGLYRARVVSWGFDTWKNKDATPFFFTILRLTHSVPDNGDEPVELESQVQRTVTLPLTTKALDLTLSRLRDHFGFDDPDMERLHPDHEEAFDLQGKEVLVSVKHDTYTDRTVRARCGRRRKCTSSGSPPGCVGPSWPRSRTCSRSPASGRRRFGPRRPRSSRRARTRPLVQTRGKTPMTRPRSRSQRRPRRGAGGRRWVDRQGGDIGTGRKRLFWEGMAMTVEMKADAAKADMQEIFDLIDNIEKALAKQGNDNYLAARNITVDKAAEVFIGAKSIISYYADVLAGVSNGKASGEYKEQDQPEEDRARKEVFTILTFLAHDMLEASEMALQLAEAWQAGANDDSSLKCPVARDKDSVVEYFKSFLQDEWDKPMSGEGTTAANEEE
jgi:hypothetical protein